MVFCFGRRLINSGTPGGMGRLLMFVVESNVDIGFGECVMLVNACVSLCAGMHRIHSM